MRFERDTFPFGCLASEYIAVMQSSGWVSGFMAPSACPFAHVTPLIFPLVTQYSSRQAEDSAMVYQRKAPGL